MVQQGRAKAPRPANWRLGLASDFWIPVQCIVQSLGPLGQQGLDWNDQAAIAELAQTLDIQVADEHVLVDGIDVTEAIRTPEITTHTRYVADNHAVRTSLVTLQRQFAAGNHCVTEGRDQASVVFPDAECKIFLTASPEQRARRRHQELLSRGERIDYEDVLEKQQQRDRQDQCREVGALVKTADSIEVCTDNLSPGEVVDRLERLVRKVCASWGLRPRVGDEASCQG